MQKQIQNLLRMLKKSLSLRYNILWLGLVAVSACFLVLYHPKISPVGLIVPHHLVTADYLDQTFKNFDRAPRRIYLLGVNHEEKGSGNIISSEDDQSISVITPYLAKYFPETQVTPYIISSHLTDSELSDFSTSLERGYQDGDLIIASLDFSHYLTRGESELRDKETLAMIERFDIEKIRTLRSDHVDGGAALATFLMVMQKMKATRMNVLWHSDAKTVLKESGKATTSYYILDFRR